MQSITQAQSFGDIRMDGAGHTLIINQVVQISVAEVRSRPCNPASPYLGLKRFDTGDKDIFFGRDQLVASNRPAELEDEAPADERVGQRPLFVRRDYDERRHRGSARNRTAPGGRELAEAERFAALHAKGQLDSPGSAATKLLAYLDRADFGTNPVADVRDPA